jgi:hypothetical protein
MIHGTLQVERKVNFGYEAILFSTAIVENPS